MLEGNVHTSCVVACQDRIWTDIHYQMDAFEDGKFPFGTACDLENHKSSYCLNGKCVKFNDEDLPVEDSE